MWLHLWDKSIKQLTTNAAGPRALLGLWLCWIGDLVKVIRSHVTKLVYGPTFSWT